MTQIQFSRTNSGLGCLVLGVLLAVAAYYILTGFFYLLWWAAPALFVLALIINWRAVLDTGKSLGGYIQRHPISGIAIGLLVAIGAGLINTGFPALNQLGSWLVQGGFPLLSLYVLLRAMGYQQLERFKRNMQPPPAPPEEEYVEFEELESRPKNAPPQTEAPPSPPTADPEPPPSGTSYDDMFR